jgi:hypothetical protein
MDLTPFEYFMLGGAFVALIIFGAVYVQNVLDCRRADQRRRQWEAERQLEDDHIG